MWSNDISFLCKYGLFYHAVLIFPGWLGCSLSKPVSILCGAYSPLSGYPIETAAERGQNNAAGTQRRAIHHLQRYRRADREGVLRHLNTFC